MRQFSRQLLAILLAIAVTGAFLPAGGALAARPPSVVQPGLPTRPSVGLGLASVGLDPLTEPPIADGVRLLSSTAEGVTFEVQVPWQELSIEPASSGYVRLSLPGWTATASAGAPELPLLAQAIGVPFGVGLSVRVQPGPAHSVALPAPVLPVGSQALDWDPNAAGQAIPSLPQPTFTVEEDPAVYGSAAAYPGALAERTSDGVVRQQRVAGIVVTPVQYRPGDQELTVYESLRVEVRFEGGEASGPAPVAESAAYEAVLRQGLLNYETARAWRQAAPASSPPLAEAWSPPNPGWRVKVRQEGMYKLTYAELLAADLPVDTLNPHTFRLYYLGSEVALREEGDGDIHFEDGEYLLFYGQAVASKYTRDNVYWLTYDPEGEIPGLRMAVRDGTPGAAETPAFYGAQRHLEGNAYYLPGVLGDEHLERWMWDYVYPPSRPSWSHTFSLAAPYGGGDPATLRVAMFGNLSNVVNPDHHTRVYLNGTLVEDAWWDGITWRIAEIQVSPALLLPGNNTLSVVCPNDTGVGVDLVYIDWAELDYAGGFQATANELPFGYGQSGTWKYRLEGFTSDQVAAYDVSEPQAVVRIDGLSVVPSGAGYAALFQDDVAAPRRYWSLTTGAYRTVQGVEADTPSDLASPANGADHVVITHAAFWNQAVALRDHRASQGLRAVAVDVRDVYDEFGYGIVGVAAIHDFLAYTYSSWQAPAPSIAVLVGDGHYDPKDYHGFGLASYLPPYLAPVDPWLGETAADNRYVTLVGNDTFPDMMLGRLAVNTTAQAATVVSKIVAYEDSPAPGDWNQHVLAVTDNTDGGGNFAQLSNALLAGYLPEPYQVGKVYYGLPPYTAPADARAAIQSGINAGALIVNYIGHAGQSSWAQENLFTTAHVAQLQNGSKLPVMLPMTCWEGYYHFPYPAQYGYDALAEVVVRTDGRGAVASWSPTGLGVAAGHDNLDTGFFQAVFQDGLRGLGQATLAGKLKLWASGAHFDLLDTYLLFGDPALRIHALDADLQVGKSVQPAGPLLPGDVLTYTVTFANTGPATAHHVVLTDIIPSELTDPTVVYASPEVIGLLPGAPFAWEIADLPPGAGGEVQVRATVGPATPPGTVVNVAQVAAAEPDPQPGNNQAAVTTDVGAEPTVRVAGIKLKYRQVKPGKYVVGSAVRITDLARLPVVGATVTAEWMLPDGLVEEQQALTGVTGGAQFRVRTFQAGTYQICVTAVTKAGWVYDPDQNLETCDSLFVP